MDFDRLRAFVWTVEEGEITAAARRLCRTQPAVTRMLQTLEEQVGAELIDRRVKPLRPTPTGERMLEHAREILRAADRMLDGSAQAAAKRQALRLGMSRSLLWQLRHQNFRLGPPPLSVTDFFVRSGWSPRLYRRFSRGEFDVAVLLMPSGWTADIPCEARRLRSEQLLIVAPGSGTRRPMTPRELGAQTWILNPDGCGFRHALTRHVSGTGGYLNVQFEVDAAPVEHLSMVAAGLGCSVVPASTLAEYPALAGQVRVLETDGFEGQLGVWMLWSRRAKPFAGTQEALAAAVG